MNLALGVAQWGDVCLNWIFSPFTSDFQTIQSGHTYGEDRVYRDRSHCTQVLLSLRETGCCFFLLLSREFLSIGSICHFSAFHVFVFHSPRNFGFREINGPKRELYFKKQNDDRSHFKLIIKPECNWAAPPSRECV